MVENRVGRLVVAYAPVVAKQLPRLWPLLLESRNRERVGQLLRDLADTSPLRRLRARLELTAALAEQIGQDARTGEERARAEAWRDRARNLRHRLEMPVGGVRARTAHRRSVRRQLDALQAEMDAHLTGPS